MTDSPAAKSETVLRLRGITKVFGALTANDDISFELKRGEVVALLGQNGAGKTTLMNILFGHYVADAGSIEVFGRTLRAGDPHAALEAGIGMVHQHFTLADNMSVLENVALGTQHLFSPWFKQNRVRRKLMQMAEDFGLQIDPNAMVSMLSVGEKQRVEILKALYRDARILILDEPTAVLTPAETDALFRTLKTLVSKGLSIIFISHKLNEVMQVSDRVLVLRAGKLVGESETADTDNKELAALMVGEEIRSPEVSESKPGESLLQLKGISAGAGSRTALQSVSLSLHAHEITGLAGVSGNGQSTLAEIVSGIREPEAGNIMIHGHHVFKWTPRAALNQGVGRIPEDRLRTGIIADMTVTENVILESYRTRALNTAGFVNWFHAREVTRKLIEDYEIKCPSPDTPTRLLSGGNMQKLILGRAFNHKPRIVLANQPTRGLDVGAVAYVHERLLEARAEGAAILLISEDLDEVLALSDRIVVIHRGKLSRPSMRGELSVRELGELMAGHGLESGDRSRAA